MKKTIIYILAILLLSVTAVTLFAFLGSSEKVFEPTEEGAATVTFTNDKTVLPDFIYNSSIIEGSAVYIMRTIDENVSSGDDADCVVLGTVIDTYYTFIDGNAWTQANVRVDESIHGRFNEGDIISVYIPGGYVSMEDYEAACGQGKYSSSGAGYIEFIVNSEPHPQIGDNAVFYIDKLPNSSPLPDGAYIRLNVIVEDETAVTSDSPQLPETDENPV